MKVTKVNPVWEDWDHTIAYDPKSRFRYRICFGDCRALFSDERIHYYTDSLADQVLTGIWNILPDDGTWLILKSITKNFNRLGPHCTVFLYLETLDWVTLSILSEVNQSILGRMEYVQERE